MGALDQSALLMEYGNIWVGDDASSLVDLGAVRNVRFSPTQVRNKVNSDNRGTIVNKVRLNGMIDFDWLEPGDLNKVESLFKGMVTKSSTAGSTVSGADQTVASGDWNYNVFIPLENQNNDGTLPTINSVTLGTDGAIVLDTDYHTVKDPATGKWGIIIRDTVTVTTESQTVAIDYDYTPAASLTITGGSSQTATNRYVKIVGPSEDDANKERIVILEEAVVSSDMVFPFVNVEDAGDVGVMPVSIESNKGTTWTYTDEINPS